METGLDPLSTLQQFTAEIEQRSDEIEQARGMPGDLARDMARTGLFRLLVPRELGGWECHPQTFFDTLARTAKADSAVGWCLMIGTTTGLLSASLPPAWAKTIYQDQPDNITVGVTAPIGRAEPRQQEGAAGWQVSGRWPFGSGSQIANWICGGCTVYENGQPRSGKNGAPETALVFFPADQVKIHTDTWDTSGLRGTGSHDIEVNDQWVPDGRWVILGGRPRVDSTLYRFPTLGLLALGVSAVAIGIAERALEEFTELAGSKTPTGASRSLANRPSVQKEVALSSARLHSACALTREYIAEAWQEAEQTGRLGVPVKARLRLAATNNAWNAAAVVDSLYHAAGGTAIYSKSMLQRCFRDVHVATQHIMVGQPTYEVVGKVQLGLDPKQPL